jgi:hypothetical protein
MGWAVSDVYLALDWAGPVLGSSQGLGCFRLEGSHKGVRRWQIWGAEPVCLSVWG